MVKLSYCSSQNLIAQNEDELQIEELRAQNVSNGGVMNDIYNLDVAFPDKVFNKTNDLNEYTAVKLNEGFFQV